MTATFEAGREIGRYPIGTCFLNELAQSGGGQTHREAVGAGKLAEIPAAVAASKLLAASV